MVGIVKSYSRDTVDIIVTFNDLAMVVSETILTVHGMVSPVALPV